VLEQHALGVRATVGQGRGGRWTRTRIWSEIEDGHALGKSTHSCALDVSMKHIAMLYPLKRLTRAI